jgi:hypothetical protein
VSEHQSRGHIISLIAGIPLAAVAATGIASAADNKAQFKYVDKSAKPGQKCSGCKLFKAPAGCTVVTGKISPNGWCISWVKK